MDDFKRLVREFAERLKATPRAPGVGEILLPGEPEWRSKVEREREGIPLPDATVSRLRETALSLGVRWD